MVIKNEQVAIAKDQIDRIDYHPQSGSRVTTESKTKVENPSPRAGARPQGESSLPTTSTSSGVSVGSKPDFETIYRRTTAGNRPGGHPPRPKL